MKIMKNLAQNMQFYQNTYYKYASDARFAHEIGISPTTLCGIYSGTTNVTLTTLQTISDALSVSPSQLLANWSSEVKKHS